MSAVVRAEGLRRHFPGDGGPVRAVDGVDLVVDQGEAVSIMGPSGCGKSTLLHLYGRGPDRVLLRRTRHTRLSRDCNHRLNHAQHCAATVRIGTVTARLCYDDCKFVEGHTPHEAIRSLKRRLSDILWTPHR
jgi:ABC-type glutathione transport system ATPase component